MAARINRLCRQTGMLEYQASCKTGRDGRHGELEDTTGFMPRCACLFTSQVYPTNFGLLRFAPAIWSIPGQRIIRGSSETASCRGWCWHSDAPGASLVQQGPTARPAVCTQAWAVVACIARCLVLRYACAVLYRSTRKDDMVLSCVFAVDLPDSDVGRAAKGCSEAAFLTPENFRAAVQLQGS
jgi:hypothetical protein